MSPVERTACPRVSSLAGQVDLADPMVRDLAVILTVPTWAASLTVGEWFIPADYAGPCVRIHISKRRVYLRKPLFDALVVCLKPMGKSDFAYMRQIARCYG